MSRHAYQPCEAHPFPHAAARINGIWFPFCRKCGFVVVLPTEQQEVDE